MAVCIAHHCCSEAGWSQSCAEWELLSERGPAKAEHALAEIPSSGQIVLFGGFDAPYISEISGETWIWSNSTWKLAADQPELHRYGHAMAYDYASQQLILFGGVGFAVNHEETLYWTGRQWDVLTSEGPSPRLGHAMASDSKRAAVVLFGGTGPGVGALGDTWEWNGTGWVELKVPGPSPRVGHCMCFDSTRGVTVLFGGYNSAETWEWDGAAWRLASLLGPPPGQHTMAFHPQLQKVILFASSTNEVQTWQWDGSFWTPTSAVGPIGRVGARMAYSPADGHCILIGGWIGSFMTPFDETWAVSENPVSITAQPISDDVLAGEPVTFTFDIAGLEPIAYQWSRNGSPLSDDGHYLGTSTPTLVIPSATLGDIGTFAATIQTECGEIHSVDAKLDVTCFADIGPSLGGDGKVDVNDLLIVISFWHGTPPAYAPADITGDGTVNVNDLLAVINSWGSCTG